MWRYDAERSAASPGDLPDELHLHWVREYPALEPAWEEQVNRDRMPFDRVYEPIVIGSTLFVGSSRNDCLTALDTRTGEEKWRFYADGPIRLPPVAGQGKVFFISDDGYLYGLNARSGALLWKVRGGSSDGKALGNGRMVSKWPARGGPVLKDGTIYFAASIWPFMGIFVYAIDAESGKEVWSNDGLGSLYMQQPHEGAVSFAGVAPQGALAVSGDALLVPSGRSVPACLDRTSGKLRYFHLASSKSRGGSHVSATSLFFFNHRESNTSMCDVSTGKERFSWKGTRYPVLSGNFCYLSGNPVETYTISTFKLKNDKTKILDRLWECKVDGTGAMIKAGHRLYTGGKDTVSALDLGPDGSAKTAWTLRVEGDVARLIAADNRLFVVTREGRLCAFGPGKTETKIHTNPIADDSTTGTDSEHVRDLLKRTSVDKGYCFVFGLDTGHLAEAVARHSTYRVVAVDPDPARVEVLRRRLDGGGLYGTRISAQVGDPVTLEAPQHVAALIVCEDPSRGGLTNNGKANLQALYRTLRPYGGVAWLPFPDAEERTAFIQLVMQSALPGARVEELADAVVLTREGPLPGSSPWTHQNGDVANSAKSDDRRVKPPLGLLWFGGNSHYDVLPRHGHGPPEQVIGGRLFIEGINMLSARDVYTGTVLWKRTFDDLGTFGIYHNSTDKNGSTSAIWNQPHAPGANARGSNYVCTPDKIYLAKGSDCLVLDPATGQTTTTLRLPSEEGSEHAPDWGYLGVYEDLLIAGSDFVPFSLLVGSEEKLSRIYDVTSSRGLVVMNRHTGKVLWTCNSKYGFRHNAIIAGGGRLFCIDSRPVTVMDMLMKRQPAIDYTPCLSAFDLRTGQKLWQKTEAVFGTWLGYSKEHDVLLQSGRQSKDMLSDEPAKRMIVYQAGDGAVIWDRNIVHGGPCILHGDTIYMNGGFEKGSAVSLLTGDPKKRMHPLTGEPIPWNYVRTYGCSSAVASEYLLTFRSGAAGFFDLATDSGTGNLGGFKSGCTSNLIVADGVLNAPDYTRTCTCSYQNQTSLALVHDPDIEMWTFNELGEKQPPSARIKRLGLNFGAPGDRRAENSTLWLDFPIVGGPSPRLAVTSMPTENRLKTVYRHASRIQSGSLPWVAASGAIGLNKLELSLAHKPEESALYSVRFLFAELEAGIEAGERVFDIALQGTTVLKDFDIMRAADGSLRTVTRTFNDINVFDLLTIECIPKSGEPLICGIEIALQP